MTLMLQTLRLSWLSFLAMSTLRTSGEMSSYPRFDQLVTCCTHSAVARLNYVTGVIDVDVYEFWLNSDEIFDMVNPVKTGCITLDDLIRCGVGDTVVAMLVDLQGGCALPFGLTS